MRVGLAAFTEKGRGLLDRVRAVWPDRTVTLYDKAEGSIGDWLKREFEACRALVFVGAVGLTVRLIAGLIRSKDTDPAVLVLDERGRYVIPVLSGHIGGANALARDLAARLGAEPVVTTATDLRGLVGIDAWAAENGCVIDNIGDIKAVSGALLEDRTVGFQSDFPLRTPLPAGLAQAAAGPLGVSISFDDRKRPFDLTLRLIPRIVTLGLGCRKGVSADALERFVLAVLAERRLSPKAVRRLASVDLKKKEPGLLELARRLGRPFLTYGPEELGDLPGAFAASDFVRKTTGVDNVCERAAVLDSGGALIFGRTAGPGMTLAAAAPDWGCAFSEERE